MIKEALFLEEMPDIAVSNIVEVIEDILHRESEFLGKANYEVRRIHSVLRLAVYILEHANSRQKRDVRTLAYEAEDLIESVVLKMERNRRDRMRFNCNYTFCAFLCDRLCTARKFRRDIMLLEDRINDVHKNISNLCADDRERCDDEEMVVHTCNSDVVGMKEERRAIVEMLLCETVTRRSAISIVGMGGLGKTTLAREVFMDPRVASHFDCMVWVDVSMQCKYDQILVDLLVQISKASTEELGKMAQYQLELSLLQSLEEVKYLIVMDDMWERWIWDIICDYLPDTGNGSRVLITTRNLEVARAADSSSLHCYLRFLNEEESLELFLKKAFPKEEDRRNFQGEFTETGKLVVRECGGLPLALKMVGNLFSKKKRSVTEWSRIAKPLIWKHEEEGKKCMEILSLSYAGLPQQLKWCFLYLSAFPKDLKIDAQKLMRLWIAEGFIMHKNYMLLEDFVEDHLNGLADSCLVQLEEWPQGKVIGCRIHNLIYELAVAKAEELDFFNCHKKKLESTTCSYNFVRRLSLNTTAEYFMGQRHLTPRLRTLLGFNFGSKSMTFNTRRLKLIRVIDLEGAPIQVVPSQVGDLTNLRYLGLRNTLIKSLPKSLKNLARLQTLDIRETLIKKLDMAMFQIKNLRHLLTSCGVELHGIYQGKLSNLKVLENVQANDWVFNCLSNLVGLRTLRLTGMKVAYHQELFTSLPRFEMLNTLELEGETLPSEFLTIFQASSLSTLILSGIIESIPQSLNYQWPRDLIMLKLSNTRLAQDPLPSLGKLSFLQVLELRMDAYYGKEMKCPRLSFQNLEMLTVHCLELLEKWTLDDGVMPHLKHLVISGSKNLAMLPQGLNNLTSLKELTLVDMSPTLYDRVKKEIGEDWMDIKHIPSITIDHIQIVANNGITS